MPARTRKTPAPAPAFSATETPAETPAPEAAPQNSHTGLTPEQLAKYVDMANTALTSFTETVTVASAPAVEVTDADREFVRKAKAACDANTTAWLTSNLPAEIPGQIAAKLLNQRYAVIRAASLELGFKAGRRDADKSNHVLKFRVKVAPEGEAAKAAVK